MADRHALIATVLLHDVQVDEVSVPGGTPLRIGRDGQLHVPVPEGAPYVAEARWVGEDAVDVTDGLGRTWRLGADDDLDIALGPLRLELRVVRRFALRRTYPVAVHGSLAWLLVVLAFMLLIAQADVILFNSCRWFGIDCPVQVEAPGSRVDGDYIARLLREDLSGEDQGGTEADPDGDPTSRRRPVVVPPEARPIASAPLPAGDPLGPVERFGGARRVAPEPVRTPAHTPDPVPPPEGGEVPLVAPEDVGEPVLDEAADTPDDDGVADAEGIDPDARADDAQPVPPPAEEELGVGMQDWMDTLTEDQEIDLMLRVARYRLRIDPDDPDALSLLAYYQYLGEDLEGAEETYDRLIELYPEDAAAYNNKALVYKRRSAWQEEEGLYRVALALDPDDTTAMNNLAVNLSHQGRHEEALAWMNRLETLLPDDPYSDLHRSKIHAEMGNRDEALRWLDRALAGMSKLDTLHHIEFRQDIRIDPSFSKLREDPAFRAILQRYYGEDSPLPEVP